MGCNTSQELKTKDGSTLENGAGGEGILSTVGAGDVNNDSNMASKSAASNHTNHAKAISITSNGDAKKDASASLAGIGTHPNGLPAGIKHYSSGVVGGEHRQCEKAEISELNDMELGEDEAKAATKIQAVFRGHQVRHTMKKSEATNTTNNQTAGSNAATGAAAAATTEPTKAELEAEFDPNDKELCDAALKIQATFRGHLSRKLVNKDTPEDDDIQEITKKVAEELDIDLTDPELHKAASKIQASFRGHKVRKDTN